ncbi:MAG: hypothetical protein K0R60_53 [Microbacterium sp.]|jgi:hypothetical protein|nr:hypothetical protein [Microbacterium sp.]
MSDWPASLKAAPIREWPGELTRTRISSKFKAGLRDTLQVLDREVWHLTENREQRDSLEMLIAIPAGTDAWRLDGRPRANAVPEHPGVIVSLDSKFGHLSYPCDTFTSWQDNLRAVALVLEALRKVDRYGVTKRGEQYRGFLAIEATAAPQGFANAHQAAAFIREVAGYEPAETWTPRIFREAQRAAHPDNGGDVDVFQRVSLAETKLRQAGLI